MQGEKGWDFIQMLVVFFFFGKMELFSVDKK